MDIPLDIECCTDCGEIIVGVDIIAPGLCVNCYTRNCVADAVKMYVDAMKIMARDIIIADNRLEIDSDYKTDWTDEKNIEAVCTEYMDKAQTKS